MLRLRTQGNPDKVSLGTPGVGSQGHLAGTLFQNITGTRFQHVPYRSVSLAMQDLIAGQIDLIFADPSGVPPVQAGSFTGSAVTARPWFAGSARCSYAERSRAPRMLARA